MKRYSSGMIVRLGFALAVFFDAETLLVDEVLAVGDSAFQAKCLREVARLRREGRTILFVSHFIPQIEHVAEDLLWLEKGRMVAYGPIEDVLPRYVDAIMGKSEDSEAAPRLAMEGVDWADERRNLVRSASPRGMHIGGDVARIEKVEFFDEQGRRTTLLESGRPCTIAVTFFADRRLDAVQVELGFAGLEDVRMGWLGTEMGGPKLRDIEGRHTVRAHILSLPYPPGRYRMGAALSNPGRKHDYFEVHYEAYAFQVRGRKDAEDVSASLPPGRFVVSEQ
jgi:hypothetical protein